MPRSIASATKAQGRTQLAGMDREVLTMTSSGNAGGTTAVCADVSGRQVDFYRDKFLLLTSGSASGQYRRITNFTASSGTFTVVPQFGTAAAPVQVASGVTAEVYTLDPAMYTIAINDGVQAVAATVRRLVEGHVLTTGRDWMSVPRNMKTVREVWKGAWRKEQDLFDRGNSTASAGGNWTATVGTWGVSSEEGYSVSDADADHLTQDLDLKDGVIWAPVRGTLNHATVYRSPALTFRIREDYLGAIDATNMLLVRLLNGVVDLRKVDNGSESSLATYTTTTSDGVAYKLLVQFVGTSVRVWLDDVEVISYELTGANLKYLDYPRSGIRWDKGGSPATAARVSEYYAFRVDWQSKLNNWEQDSSEKTIRFVPRSSISPYMSGELLFMSGTAPLSMLDEDTTAGTLATDTTAKIEIATTDEEWPLLMAFCKAQLMDLAADPAWNGNLATIPFYEGRAKQARQELRSLMVLAAPIPAMKGIW